MRDNFKDPNECSMDWTTKFLEGNEPFITFWKKRMTICQPCKDFNVCFPSYEEWPEHKKNIYRDLCKIIIEDRGGE